VTDISVPKLNNNDDVYVLVEWLVGDDQPVEADEPLATIETAKAIEELVCTETGVLWHLVPAGATCVPGEVIARVVPAGTQREARTDRIPSGDGDGVLITRPAQALAEELGIDQSRLYGLGRKVIRRAEVAALSGDGRSLTAGQRAVARTVEESHREIPAAYTVMVVDVGAAEDAARRVAQRIRLPVGLPELLIAAVAGLHGRFPACFAGPDGDGGLRPAPDANVGLTVDVGGGLFIPVVKRAAERTVEDIAAVTHGFRRTALSGKFRADELTGGTITVALHHEPDVLLAIPLVVPGQTATLALAASRREATVGDDGTVGVRTVANVGLAYDHRFINGHQAIQFLRAVQAALESPELP
jgi:2-oxoglutarate dehydrogenase E2 component (dihydrolipoamide succinyltransferase)